MHDEHHEGALLEDINDKLQRLAEGVSTIIERTQEISTVVARIPVIEGDIKVIKAVVSEHTEELRRIGERLDGHETRLHTLEQAA